jgi:hypothetical protein
MIKGAMQDVRSLALTMMLAVMSATAQDAALPAGRWEGVIKPSDREVPVVVNLGKNEKQAWIGSIDINLPNAPQGLPLEEVTVNGADVSFVLSAGQRSTFRGKIDAEAKTIAGTATGAGGEVPFELKRTGDGKVASPAPSTAIAKELEGDWEGTLDAGQSLRLIITFRSAEGKGTGQLVSVDQNNATIPLSQVLQDGAKVVFAVQVVGGKFEGTLNEPKTELKGEWSQGGNTFPLTLTKKKPAEVK